LVLAVLVVAIMVQIVFWVQLPQLVAVVLLVLTEAAVLVMVV
jgi:hypothetical protein